MYAYTAYTQAHRYVDMRKWTFEFACGSVLSACSFGIKSRSLCQAYTRVQKRRSLCQAYTRVWKRRSLCQAYTRVWKRRSLCQAYTRVWMWLIWECLSGSSLPQAHTIVDCENASFLCCMSPMAFDTAVFPAETPWSSCFLVFRDDDVSQESNVLVWVWIETGFRNVKEAN
jgi:hypothetical protein